MSAKQSNGMLIDRVFIIESEGPKDLFDHRSEGEILERLLSLMGVKTVLRKVTSKAEFLHNIGIFGLSGAGALHVSSHGNDQCLAFQNGDICTWTELFAALEPHCDRLILNLSSCQAAGQEKLISLFREGSPKPMMVSGCPQSISWKSAAVAWSLLYHALSADVDDKHYTQMRNTVQAIRLATGYGFKVWWFGKGDNGKCEVGCFDAESIDAEAIEQHRRDGVSQFLERISETKPGSELEGKPEQLPLATANPNGAAT